MSNPLLPGIEQAIGTAAYLHDVSPSMPGVPSGCPYTPEHKRLPSPREIERFRYAAAVTSEISLDELAEVQVGSWNDLSNYANDVIQGQMNILQRNTAHSLSDYEKRDADNHLDVDGRAGTYQVAAFLRVLPRVLFVTDFENPNVDIAKRAAMSKKTIVGWSRTDEQTDTILVYGTASPKPDLESDDEYQDLTLHPKWFEEKPNGAVGFKGEKLPHMRDHKNRKLRLNAESKYRFLGCPAIKLVPRLYDAMTEAAQANNLFGSGYTLERINHGYTELQQQ
ncbi:hypothetical protein BH09PAT3_BH09PAT3_2610 [soil metagenome]